MEKEKKNEKKEEEEEGIQLLLVDVMCECEIKSHDVLVHNFWNFMSCGHCLLLVCNIIFFLIELF